MPSDKTSFTYIVSRFFRIYLPGERGFSTNTISSYRDTFKQVIVFFKEQEGIPPEKLKMDDFSKEVVARFLAMLERDGKSVSTRNQRLAAIKSFFGYVKYSYPEYLHSATGILLMRMKKQPEATVSYMSADAVSRLLRKPQSGTREGYRDMLILTLLYDSGARVSEITGIRVGDIRLQKPATIVLHGKGGKDRIVPLSEKMVALLQTYFNKERLSNAENRDKLLFVNHSGSQLTRAGIAYLLKKYVELVRREQPDLIPGKFSPHCMRHSKAMHLLQAGVELIYIRDFLGHRSVKTTEVYAKSDGLHKRKALEKACSVIQSPDPDLAATWNDDASLMRFLAELCEK
jgi:site-specific recombinase XerD